ncbi:MAG TPA: glycosyltransferase family 4 protein [Candidatus Deferrimicrobium sp.]|nr:glycosyltransferase family 4 protein [Candidatus Deferrimicrobium sp.]
MPAWGKIERMAACIHQLLTFFSYGDAIGNEAFEIRNFLRAQGYESEIFSYLYHPKYAGQIVDYRQYKNFSNKKNILIFHFSIGSPVTEKFLQVPDKRLIIYHNITPYHFFLDYHRVLMRDCYLGRVELKRMVGKVDLALGDSLYNEQELQETGFVNTGVLPLVMNFKKFEKPVVPVLENLFNDGKTNILFVGRIIPSKRVEDVLKSFHLYQKHFNAHSRLFIVGEYRGLERYLGTLQDLMLKLGVKDVHFTGHIPDDELVSYFKLSHLYIHMSEHEGFCAPVPESFYLNIPVIAFNAGAVRETMNNGGILVNRKDFIGIAALLDRILTDGDLKAKIIVSQQKALQKYQQNKTGKILLEYILKLS